MRVRVHMDNEKRVGHGDVPKLFKKDENCEVENMKKYNIEIEGTADMMQNRLNKELNDEIKKVPRADLEKWEEDNWRKKLYTREVDGKMIVVLPANNILSALEEGARKYRVPAPKIVGRTWTAYVKSTVILDEDYGILENCEVMKLGCMVNGNPSNTKKSSKVYKVRPVIRRGWKCKFSVVDLDDKLDVQTLTELFKSAGMYVGIGDWRPRYGRFTVTKVLEVRS